MLVTERLATSSDGYSGQRGRRPTGLGFALPSASDLVTAAGLLAAAVR
ncbi:MAG TPA: hypothetical protein VGH88_13485 [Streptosporangiaceae bacterium]|jgi:hypothetical protein